MVDFPGGWDSAATLVDGRWVDRRPRRPDVARRLMNETRLMPWLAPLLPLPVPVPRVLREEPLVVRHEMVPGEPLEEPDAEQGRQLGAFLRALHDVEVDGAVRHSLPPLHDSRLDRELTLRELRDRVLPQLPEDAREAGGALLDAVRRLPFAVLVHGDLGPEHVLAEGGTLTGVIDFGDVHIGDPGIDLAWALLGTPPEFAAALAETYGVTAELRGRALLWHRLGPWYEVLYGLDTGDAESVGTGMAGTLRRLR